MVHPGGNQNVEVGETLTTLELVVGNIAEVGTVVVGNAEEVVTPGVDCTT